MHWDGSWFMGWMPLVWIPLIILVVVVLSRLAGASKGSGLQPPSRETPEEVLKTRYARGEIDRDEYEQNLEDLRR